jgi:hypothetical protein
METLDQLLAEADSEINYDGSPPNKINPVLIVVDRNEIVSFDSTPHNLSVQFKNLNVPVIAFISLGKDDDEQIIDYQRFIHDGLKYRILLAMEVLIGTVCGVYPFMKILKRLVPKSWRSWDDISDEPGFNK